MKNLALTGKYGKGKYALIDDEDYDRLSKWKWNLNGRYIVAHPTQFKIVSLHRFLLNAPKGMEVDHINGDRLDNRKENLRLCTSQQNKWNSAKPATNISSKYKGVTYLRENWPRKKRWKSSIRYNHKSYYLGVYATERQAAVMYDFWATELFGEFARTNFKVVAHG